MGVWMSIINEMITEHNKRVIKSNTAIQNTMRKMITEYKDSDIAGFIDEWMAKEGSVKNYIISGVDNDNQREKAMFDLILHANNIGIPVCLLHEGNSKIEGLLDNAITQVVSQNMQPNVVMINSSFPYYDPFFNRDAMDISDMMKNVSTSNKLNSTSEKFLHGMIKYYTKVLNQKPYTYTMHSCNYKKLSSIVELNYQSGKISEYLRDDIINLLSEGQDDIGTLASFFSELMSKSKGVIDSSGVSKQLFNITKAFKNNGIISIDIGSRTRRILLDLIMQDLDNAVSMSKECLVIIDKINVNSCNKLFEFIDSLPNKCKLVISSDDVYSMLNSNDQLFDTVMTRTEKAFMMRHGTDKSSRKMSESIGQYDHEDVVANYGGNKSSWRGEYTTSDSISIQKRKEFVVTPEEFRHLEDNEAYIRDTVKQELSHVKFRT